MRLSKRKTFVGIMASALWLGMISCLPTVANFSKGEAVPPSVATLVPKEAELLILPLWEDMRMPYFHSAYVIPAQAIGTEQAAVPRRVGMYLDTLVCGGPTTWVTGYLVVVNTGFVVWSNARGDYVTDGRRIMKAELTRFITSGEIGPELRDLIPYGSMKIAFDLTKEERTLARRLIDSIPDDAESVQK